MKPQDILFFLILFILIGIRKSNWIVTAGVLSVLISIPLFSRHIFFTAEHLTYYAAGFFLTAVGFQLYENRH